MKRFFVHTRLRIQRGQAFVGMLFSTLAVVGIWRQYLPAIHWWIWVMLAGSCYIAIAWIIGWTDERVGMFRIEQEKYAEQNPILLEVLKRVIRIEAKVK